MVETMKHKYMYFHYDLQMFHIYIFINRYVYMKHLKIIMKVLMFQPPSFDIYF